MAATTYDVGPDVSVIVPARNEEDCLANCLQSLVGQAGPSYEIILVDDHSTDATQSIAAKYPVRMITANPLPPGWSGKCNAAWTGAGVAKGKWFLFTDADTQHVPESLARGLREANEYAAGLVSYSPKQVVRSVAERALMPVIFAELASTYRPRDVCDPNSPVAAANGQYLLIAREVYEAVGGHKAVAGDLLEDVELAKRVKQAGYRLRFRVSDVVSARMYRSFGQMWEGWTKNLALLFAHPRRLAFNRLLEFAAIMGCLVAAVWKWTEGQHSDAAVASALLVALLSVFQRRIRQAHFDWLSNTVAVFGLPLFALLLLNSDISHRRGRVRWKGREYSGREIDRNSSEASPQSILCSPREDPS